MNTSLQRQRGGERRKSFKERLGFVGGMGCCGGGAFRNSSNMEEEGRDVAEEVPGMNLATALAVERQFRAEKEETPMMSVSLKRLLKERDDDDGGGGGGGDGEVCCVCMGRKKGAAFIPCGHTFCRVCSRELWLNRGSCPICNRSILEILDIF